MAPIMRVQPVTVKPTSFGDERDDDGDKADGADQHARQCDEAQRLYRKAGDAVEGKAAFSSAGNGFRPQCVRRARSIR